VRTSINGEPAEWPQRLHDLFAQKVQFAANERCTSANYFTARPYRNEYDTGSNEEGFVYTVNLSQVGKVAWTPTKEV